MDKDEFRAVIKHFYLKKWPVAQIKAEGKVYELEFKLLPHPPYSPGLVLSDFFLFPNLKIWLGGNTFPSDDEVIAAVDEYFKGFETSYFSKGIKKLEERWTKCVEVERHYVEK